MSIGQSVSREISDRIELLSEKNVCLSPCIFPEKDLCLRRVWKYCNRIQAN